MKFLKEAYVECHIVFKHFIFCINCPPILKIHTCNTNRFGGMLFRHGHIPNLNISSLSIKQIMCVHTFSTRCIVVLYCIVKQYCCRFYRTFLIYLYMTNFYLIRWPTFFALFCPFTISIRTTNRHNMGANKIRYINKNKSILRAYKHPQITVFSPKLCKEG